MALGGARGGLLWRYNYKILVGTGYWVLVLPIAASQVVTLWMMALAADFSQSAGTQIAELMVPILGAFLVAHSLAPEYRSGIGTVLACKPVSLHRVVTIRIGLAMLAAVVLSFVTLQVCSIGMKPIDVWTPLLASLPGLWFLSMLALCFASLFRNALAGFAVAAALWALDLTLGFGIHPLLSLQGLLAKQELEPLSNLWLVGKGALLGAGLLLLLWHGRLLRRISRPPERRDVTRIAVYTAAVALAYAVSGAATTISYAHLHRANLGYADVVWLQRQLRLYGPVPVAWFFGPAFSTYVASPSTRGEVSGATLRLRQLEAATKRWPNSIWADGIAYSLAMEGEQLEPAQGTARYFAVADRFGASPFAPRALAAVLRSSAEEITDVERLTAARRLLADYPRAPEAEPAAGFLLDRYPAEIHPREMLPAALAAADVAARYRRPTWLATAAQIQAEQGDAAGARANAQRVLDLVVALRAEDSRSPGQGEVAPHIGSIDRAGEEAKAVLRGLDGEGAGR